MRIPLCYLTFTVYLSAVCAKKPLLFQATRPFEHGEGPTWDSRKGLLYFVDLHRGKVVSYDPIDEKVSSVKLNGDVSPVIPSKADPDLLVVGLNRSIVAIEWDGRQKIKKQVVLTTVAKDKPSSRFNDGKADKNGRLWFGTMGYENASGVVPNEGSLFFVHSANLDNPNSVISPVNVSNGMAWNRENDKFFYIDTPTKQVKEYDYDNDSGRIWNARVAFDMKNHPEITGWPDGMTIDDDDNLWIALYGGGAVIKVDPANAQLLQVVAIPAQYVTSVAWGGPLMDTLYVTSSRFVLSAEESLRQPAAGAVFGISNLGTKGLPAFEADIIETI